MQQRVNARIENLINTFKAELYSLPIERSMLHAEQLGLLLRSNSLGIYSLNDIESFYINKISLDLPKGFSFELIGSQANDKIVFMATELYHTGGHTRLMERLATFLDCKPDLFLTKKPSESIIERERQFFSVIKYEKKLECSLLERILSSVKTLLQYNVIVLNIHPEDIYAVVVCGLAKKINKKIKVHFVNHADHTFSFGGSVADVWYEISEYGRAIDVKRNIYAKKCFLGIPIENAEQDIEIEGGFEFNDGDLILTAASNNKYKPVNGFTIIPLVNQLLNTYKQSTMQVIGAKPMWDYWWWCSKLKFGGRLILSKSLPYEEYLKVTGNAKLYIDSHPMPGGTAFAEQFLQGRLCTGLKSYFKGYTPAEMLKRDNKEEVVRFIDNVDCLELSQVKELMGKIHGINSVKERFLNSLLRDKCDNCFFVTQENVVQIIELDQVANVPADLKLNSINEFVVLFNASKLSAFILYLVKRVIKWAKQKL